MRVWGGGSKLKTVNKAEGDDGGRKEIGKYESAPIRGEDSSWKEMSACGGPLPNEEERLSMWLYWWSTLNLYQ